MKLGGFLGALAVIALVASIFSPSAIGVATNSLGELTGSQTGLTEYVSLMHHQGYRVEVANTTQQESSFIRTPGAVVLLIDPDKAINSTIAQALFSEYQNGSISLILAEGNSTNEAPLLADFGASVTGAAINDTASSFADQRVFDIALNLGTPVVGQIDVGSPIILNPGSMLSPVAQSSALSFDSLNSTFGPRTVVAATASPGSSARTILISSSSPFTNCGLSQCSSMNDTALDVSIVSWASAGNTSRPVVIDAAHYTQVYPPPRFGVPVGWIMLMVLNSTLSYAGGFGFSGLSTPGSSLTLFGHVFPGSFATVLELAVPLLLLAVIWGRLSTWFANEKPVKDDQPLPAVEKDIISQSKERLDFLSASRNKSFYVATLAQLYEVLDDVTKLEFGAGIHELSTWSLTERLGEEKAEGAKKMLDELSKYYDYANNRGRFILPPGLSWKRTVTRMTALAEEFLNDLGMTMAGKEGGQRLEYALKQ